jgi:hypothetical protein
MQTRPIDVQANRNDGLKPVTTSAFVIAARIGVATGFSPSISLQQTVNERKGVVASGTPNRTI